VFVQLVLWSPPGQRITSNFEIEQTVNIVLLSTYELGRQPFGLASPAAWLREAGTAVTCCDLSRSPFPQKEVLTADLVAFYLPMHTATRLAFPWVERVRALNPLAHLCFYGLYAPINEHYLRKLGAQTILGGEFEEGLVTLVRRLAVSTKTTPEGQTEPVISIARQQFRIPDRTGLPGLDRYAKLDAGDGSERLVGYTEASRGCRHLCHHCPIVTVYKGRFRIVQRDVVLADIRQQVAAGAAHITFGDPDFFNGIGHSLALVEALHREHPRLTYDVTIKIEHLLRYAHHLRTLRRTGCLFVVSAVESLDDRALQMLDKGHTREDFARIVELFREVGLTLSPTFIPFAPWTTVSSYRELLAQLAEMDLIENVAPVQLAIRLLIPPGSALLAIPEISACVEGFDEKELSYRWSHADPRVEELYREVRKVVTTGQAAGLPRLQLFIRVWEATQQVAGDPPEAAFFAEALLSRAAIPYINEPWFC